MKQKSLILYTIAALTLSACGSESGGSKGDVPLGNTKTAITNPVAVAPSNASTTSKSSASLDGMNGAINTDWAGIERQRMQNEASQADKKREFNREENELNRKHESAMEDKRIEARKEGQFMNTLKELMHMQVIAGMIHPDKCANKGFINGLKSTAEGLREAMEPTKKAEAIEAKTEAPATPTVPAAPEVPTVPTQPAIPADAAPPAVDPAPAKVETPLGDIDPKKVEEVIEKLS